jgi:AcrR family transcriptional regulator
MPPAKGTTTTRRIRTREALVAAAELEFAERGIGATSVEQLCDRAGYTRGAFYSNFASKEELALAVIAGQEDAVLGLVADAVGGAPEDVAGTIRSVLDALASHGPERRRRRLLRTELSLMAARDAVVGRAWLAHLEHLDRRLASVIEDAVGRHGLVLTVEATDLARTAIAMSEAGTEAADLRRRRAPGDDLLARVLPAVVGAATRPA